MNNKDLIKQYVDTGLQLPEYQVSKLPKNLAQTYIRKRLIGVQNTPSKLATYECELIENPEQLIYYFKHLVKKYKYGISPKTYIEDMSQYPDLKILINKAREIFRDDNKVREIVVDGLIEHWIEEEIHIPFEFLRHLSEPLLKKYSEKRLKRVVYDGRDDLIYDKWMLKYGDDVIKKFVNEFKDWDSLLFYLKTWKKRGDRVYMSLLDVFMHIDTFNQSLEDRSLFYIIIQTPESNRKQVFDWYLKNGGNMDIIKRTPELQTLYNKAIGNEQ